MLLQVSGIEVVWTEQLSIIQTLLSSPRVSVVAMSFDDHEG